MDKITDLTQKVTAVISYIPHSRIHSLRTFNTSLANTQIKRDDELGFGISGSKLRKYSSLIPYLLKQSCQEAVLIGSAYSNHILGMSQKLIENGIKPTLFLLGHKAVKRQGNLLLTSLLVPESQWHWISRKNWPQVETLALDYIKNTPLSAVLIPEGACMEQALPGALTLALDILQNEQPFDHIFLDAGTGLSAIATILAFAWVGKKTRLHILLLAGAEKAFLEKLKKFQKFFETFVGTRLDWSKIVTQFKLYLPTQARSFGSVTTTIINYIKKLARDEGFLTDPIYSAKLFWEAKNIIPGLKGNVLIVHSGGALTLMGFQSQLSSLLSTR